jgi:hypothetical protein
MGRRELLLHSHFGITPEYSYSPFHPPKLCAKPPVALVLFKELREDVDALLSMVAPSLPTAFRRSYELSIAQETIGQHSESSESSPALCRSIST